MYRYYQVNDRSEWKITKDDDPDNPWSVALDKNASRVSILSLTADPRVPLQQGETVGYSGPMYFDIDIDADIEKSIQSANELCNKLIRLNVHQDDIEIHLSGKKGVHVFLPSKTFIGKLKLPDPNLVDLYADLAFHLWVEGLDFQVYSKSKGRMFRPPNSQREPGTYKVRVSLDELRELTEEQYKDLCKNPRQMSFREAPLLPAKELTRFFESLKVKHDSRVKKQKDTRAVSGKAFEGLAGNVPDCIKKLAAGEVGGVDGASRVSLNHIAIHLGCWVKMAQPSEDVLDSVNRMVIKNIPSSSGQTEELRLKKSVSTQQYVAVQDKYQFSCGSLKKLITSNPDCDSCPVKQYQDKTSANPEQALNNYFLYEANGCYYADPERTAMVASFTLQRDVVIVEEDTDLVLSSVMLLTNPLKAETITINNFSEEAWLTKLNFKRELSGVDGIAFFGSDNDVLRLRLTVARNDLLNAAESQHVYSTDKAGINYRRRSGPDDPRHPDHRGRLTYVEDGFSVNDVGVINTHKLSHPVIGVPKLGLSNLSGPLTKENNEAFSLLLQSNLPEILSMVIPWFFATHIKPQIYVLEQRFPLLALYGIAETGKNSTAKVMMRLCGLTGESAKYTLEAPQCTKFPFQDGLSNTTTIPRVINECNQKSLDKYQYRTVLEMLKAAYDSQTINKGTIGHGARKGVGAHTVSWRITAPVAFMTEEPIDMPAVAHRSIAIDLTPKGKDYGRESFKKLEPRADDLCDIGRVLMKASLSSPVKTVQEILETSVLPEEVVSSDLQDRNKFNYLVLLTAYNWAIPHLEKIGLSPENVQALWDLKETYLDHLRASLGGIITRSNTSEIDYVVRDIMLMAGDSQTHYALALGRHFAIDPKSLYLDMTAIYPRLQMYKHATRTNLNISSERVFMNLIPSAPYYMGYAPVPNQLDTKGRPVVILDLDILSSMGFPITMMS